MSTEFWQDWNRDKREKHRRWNEQNLSAIGNTELPFQIINWGETVIFREANMPMVDFYPSTGRWRMVGKDADGKTHSGGAGRFLAWYQKQVTA